MYSRQNTSQDQESIQAPLRLWRHVFGGQRGLLHVFTGVRQGGELTKVKWANFKYPEAAEAAAQWALEKSEQGREVYHCGHLLDAADRIKENAASVRTLWGELDGAAPPNGEFKPTALVESSPGHFHVYWRLKSAIPPAVAEKLNKALAREIGADASGFDLTQLLRVPQTTNHKHAERPVVRLMKLDGSREYGARDLEERLQPEPCSKATDAPKSEDEEDEPPVRLGGAGLRRWRGEVVERGEDGELDRSRSLVQIARMLAHAGATKRTVVEALRDRDVALGWNKYATRNDGGKKAYGDLADDVCGPFEGSEGPRGGEGEPQSSSSSDSYTQGDDENYPEPEIVWFHKLGKPKARKFVIEKVARKGYPLVLFGAGGVAKSFAVLAAGIAIASEAERGLSEWLGLRVLEHGYCLYVDLELDVDEQHARVTELCTGLGVEVPKRLAYLSGRGMDRAQAFGKAFEFAKTYDTVAVIVDSVGQAITGDMDKNKDVNQFFRRFIEPFSLYGTTPILVDHEGKLQAGERHKDKSIIGGVYKSNNARGVMQFVLEAYDKNDHRLDIRVRVPKINFEPPEPFGISITFEPGSVSIETRVLPDEELLDEEREPLHKRVYAALEIEPLSVVDLVRITKAADGSIRNTLSSLMQQGRVDGTQGRPKLYFRVDGPSPDGSKQARKEDDFVTRGGQSEGAGEYNHHRSPLGKDDDDYINDTRQAGSTGSKESQAQGPPLRGEARPYESVSDLFQDPPDWLRRHLEEYQKDPARHIGALCSAVAAEVAGAIGPEDVREEVEQILYVLYGPAASATGEPDA